MSGHSKWATIKRKKGALDAARGRIFTRIIKEITVAARHGGGDPNINPRLRLAVANAKASNMPADNIKKAIQRGTGELPGITYEEITYEGFGPGGVAVLIEAMTDNKNRTVSEIRHLFSKYNGNLGESGSVKRMFERSGVIEVDKGLYKEDDLLGMVLDAGGEDLQVVGDVYEIYTHANDFEKVKDALEKTGVQIKNAEMKMNPTLTVRLEGKNAESMLKLMEALEEHDDAQHVYANFDIDESIMEAIG